MNRFEDLTAKLLDGTLSAPEERELVAQLESDREAKRIYLKLLEVEAALRIRSVPPRLTEGVMARLKSATEEALPMRVIEQIKADRPGRVVPFPKALDHEEVQGAGRALLTRRSFGKSKSWKLGLAAALVLLLGLTAIWFFNPPQGALTLAEMSGAVRLDRNGRSVAAVSGVPLLPGDVLLTGTNSASIAFGKERTRFNLAAQTELRIDSSTSGKHFDLQTGRLDAEVARQPPFKPLMIATPNTVVTVVGTRFSLETRIHFTRLTVDEGRVKLTDTSQPGSPSVIVTKGRTTVAAPGIALAVRPKAGGLTREWWNGVTWNRDTDSLNDPRFPGQPDGRDTLDSFEITPFATNHFGVRLCGYVYAPVTGDYEFWMAAAPGATLYLSRNDDAQVKEIIANPGEGKPHEWDIKFTSRQATGAGGTSWSGPFPLESGKRYYIEAVLSIPQGQGHLSVAWKRPGAARELLTGEYLSPLESIR